MMSDMPKLMLQLVWNWELRHCSVCHSKAERTVELECDLTRCMKRSPSTYRFQVFTSIRTEWWHFNTWKRGNDISWKEKEELSKTIIFATKNTLSIYLFLSKILCVRTIVQPRLYLFSPRIWSNNLPVAYKGTECVKKPPAATTHRVWSRRTSSFALSGVSTLDPFAFFTGANSSSRNTWAGCIKYAIIRVAS